MWFQDGTVGFKILRHSLYALHCHESHLAGYPQDLPIPAVTGAVDSVIKII